MAAILITLYFKRSLTKLNCGRFTCRFYCAKKAKVNFKRKLNQYLEDYSSEIPMRQMCFQKQDGSGFRGISFSGSPLLYQFTSVEDAQPLSLQEIFLHGFNFLEDYLKDKPLEMQPKTALTALESFYESKSIHEINLRKLRRPDIAKSETAIMSMLAVHFLTQLIPWPDNYYLDKFASLKGDGCPCGCGKLLQFGITFLGNTSLFYGSPDIVLFTNGENVFTPDGCKSSVFLTKKGNTFLKNSYAVNLEDEDFIINEVKRERFDKMETEQLLRQAIAMSICYRKKLQNGAKCTGKQNMDSTIIPTCGITSNGYEIAMYDSNNDILLLSDDTDLQLFEDDGSIRFSAMVNLWMVIHHPLFCCGLWKEAINENKGSCNIKSIIRNDQELQDIIDGSTWFFNIERRAPSEKPKYRRDIKRMPFSRVLQKKLPSEKTSVQD